MEFSEIKQLEKNFRDLNYSNFINTKIQSAHILYTNPLGVFNDKPDEKVDIQSKLVDEIQKDECRSFVVLGDSGSGKTSLALHLCNEYWKKISTKSDEDIRKNQYVPLYISLRQIELHKDCENILSTFCETAPGKIKAADLSNWNLLLLLDGYDELVEKINLWDHNNWWLPDHTKKIKTVTFCKTIGLKFSERERYFTFGYNEKSKFISVLAFETDQIEDYIRKTTAFLRSISIDDEEPKNDPWMMTKKITVSSVAWETDTKEYLKWLTTTFPDLQKLAGNPYLLTIILQILPGIVEDCKQSASSLSDREQERSIRIRCSTEIGIYDEFVAQWFKYQATKNRKNKSNPNFMDIPVDHLSGFMKAYSQNLAFTLIQKNGGFLGDGSVSEADSNLCHLWKPVHNKELLDLVETDPKYSSLFPKDKDDNDDNRIHNFQSLRNASFLSNPAIGMFRFFHSSLVEYLASREVFENIRGRFNFYLHSDDPIYDNEFGINTTDLTDSAYHPLLKNLAQRAQTNDSFKSLLFQIIELSKEILILSQMSANAITILNFAGISLSGRDFRNVQIAKANLTGANTANSDFQFANLSGANVQQSWMVGCRFQGANFDGVNFGQNSSVDIGYSLVAGIVQYMKEGMNNLVISCTKEEVYNYNYSSGVFSEMKNQTFAETHLLYVVGHLLLNQKIFVGRKSTKPPVYEFFPIEQCLAVNVWNLHLNEQMEGILFKNPNCLLAPVKYWISKELLEVATDKTDLEIACDEELKSDLTETELLSNKFRGQERVYYYEIQSHQTADIRLVLLWGYVINEGIIVEYREPQILDANPVVTEEDDKGLFRFYSDFKVFGCAIYLNKLVAIQGQNFLLIFSLSTHSLVFKDTFLTDSIENDDIKFSPNGQYLIYKSDFVYLCIISEVRVKSTVKVLKIETENITKFFVVFDKSCEMFAFLYDRTIFICKLPSCSIIQKRSIQFGLDFSLSPTFAFIDERSNDGGINKLFSYVTINSSGMALETIFITETIEPLSHTKVKKLGQFCVSNDNRRVAAFYNKYGETNSSFISVFNTPMNTQSLLFQTHIQFVIHKVLFTPNYLLVMVNSKMLVLDMSGNYFPSIKFPLELNVRTYISSKYQEIVLASYTLDDKLLPLQLCSIVERVTENRHECPVALENTNKSNCNENINVCLDVCQLTFDSKDGSHILIQDFTGYIWLWIPSQKWHTKILVEGVPIERSLSDIHAFYVIYEGNKRKICAFNYSGFLYIKVYADNSAMVKKRKDYNNTMGRFYLNVDWYIYGNRDGQLYIYHLNGNDNDCLAEFLFPHAVSDFNLHYKYNNASDVLERIEILAWDFNYNISSLVVEDINLKATDFPTPDSFHKWKLNWTVKSNSVLSFQDSVIAKTFKVNESNKRLLNNLKVNSDIGEPWPEKIAYFSLSELYMPITEADTKFAIINTKNSGTSRMPIMADMWVVSAIARNSNPTQTNTALIEHVGLLIEGINNGRHFVMEAELTANKKKGYVRIKLVPVSTTERLDQLKNEYIARQWMRPKADIQMLIRSIQNDQIDSRKYNLLRNNCATWCMEKLKEIGIKRDRKKWYRKIILADLPSDLFRIKDRIVKNRLPFKVSNSV